MEDDSGSTRRGTSARGRAGEPAAQPTRATRRPPAAIFMEPAIPAPREAEPDTAGQREPATPGEPTTGREPATAPAPTSTPPAKAAPARTAPTKASSPTRASADPAKPAPADPAKAAPADPAKPAPAKAAPAKAVPVKTAEPEKATAPAKARMAKAAAPAKAATPSKATTPSKKAATSATAAPAKTTASKVTRAAKTAPATPKTTLAAATAPPQDEPPADTPPETRIPELAARHTPTDPRPVPSLWDRVRAEPRQAPELLATAAVERYGPEADRYTRWIRATYPAASDDRIAQAAARRFTAQARRAALAAVVGRGAGEAAALGWVQARMVLHIAAAYRLDPAAPERAADLLTLMGSARVPVGAGVRAAGRGLATRLVPGAGLLLGALLNDADTGSLARRAISLYRPVPRLP